MYEIRYGNGILIGTAKSVGEAKKRMVEGSYLEPVSGKPVTVAGLYREKDGTRVGTLQVAVTCLLDFTR